MTWGIRYIKRAPPEKTRRRFSLLCILELLVGEDFDFYFCEISRSKKKCNWSKKKEKKEM